MPDASPQPPKPKKSTASKTRIEPKLSGRRADGFAFVMKADPSTIIAPQRSVNELPMSTATAEAVTPGERGIRPPSRYHARDGLLIFPKSRARHNRFHCRAELVDLLRRSVYIRAHANAVEVRPCDGHDENVVFAEQCVAQLAWLNSVEMNGAKRAGLVRPRLHQHFSAGNFA